ncbi:MAG: hypothetical protein LBH76_01195 [Propionibacteriaceae bacterium]|nr:hypothetical protein [Propionibacteriaceae bacterium]
MDETTPAPPSTGSGGQAAAPPRTTPDADAPPPTGLGPGAATPPSTAPDAAAPLRTRPGAKSAGPPLTGHGAIDAALAAVADLDGLDVAEHPERLAAAHAALRAVLDGAGAAAGR